MFFAHLKREGTELYAKQNNRDSAPLDSSCRVTPRYRSAHDLDTDFNSRETKAESGRRVTTLARLASGEDVLRWIRGRGRHLSVRADKLHFLRQRGLLHQLARSETPLDTFNEC